MKNPYEVLSVAKDADEKTIKDAYRRLARKYHPDVNSDTEDKFKEIQAAYDVLSDKKKRTAYDQFGDGAFGGGGGGGRGGYRVDPNAHGFPSFDSIFGGEGGAGDILSSLFGGGGRRTRRQAPPQDHEIAIDVSFEEAHRGVERELRIELPSACDRCGGRGQVATTGGGPCQGCGGSGKTNTRRGILAVATPCAACRGTGTGGIAPCEACSATGAVRRRETVKVRIPEGIEDGGRLRLPARKGVPGKIFIIVKVLPDSRFEREGDDLSGEVSVSITEAALGAEVPVVTLDGEQVVRIPPATPSGRKLRLSGKGFAKRKGGRGDLYVRIKIVPPPEPNDEERALLEELGKIASFDPRNDA